MPVVLKKITAAAEYNHCKGDRAWIRCLGHKQRGSSQIQKKVDLVVAQDLVGLCSGGDHLNRGTIHPAQQHLDKLVLAPYCLLDKARINLKRQRRRYQTQERKGHPHFWCN
jgi:hypothetical protein